MDRRGASSTCRRLTATGSVVFRGLLHASPTAGLGRPPAVLVATRGRLDALASMNSQRPEHVELAASVA